MSTACFFELLEKASCPTPYCIPQLTMRFLLYQAFGMGRIRTRVMVDRADGYVDLSLGSGEHVGLAHLDTHTPSSAHLLH